MREVPNVDVILDPSKWDTATWRTSTWISALCFNPEIAAKINSAMVAGTPLDVVTLARELGGRPATSLDSETFGQILQSIHGAGVAYSAGVLPSLAAPKHGAEGALLRKPPKGLQRILWALLPARDRDAILGDALEDYNKTLHEHGKPGLAAYCYVKEVFYAAIAGGWQRFLQALSVLRRGQ